MGLPYDNARCNAQRSDGAICPLRYHCRRWLAHDSGDVDPLGQWYQGAPFIRDENGLARCEDLRLKTA